MLSGKLCRSLCERPAFTLHWLKPVKHQLQNNAQGVEPMTTLHSALLQGATFPASVSAYGTEVPCRLSKCSGAPLKQRSYSSTFLSTPSFSSLKSKAQRDSLSETWSRRESLHTLHVFRSNVRSSQNEDLTSRDFPFHTPLDTKASSVPRRNFTQFHCACIPGEAIATAKTVAATAAEGSPLPSSQAAVESPPSQTAPAKARKNERGKMEGSSKNAGKKESRPDLVLYNTMTRQKEVFKPKVEGRVSMYVCGVTAYDYSHIGHARVYVAFDVLFRYLQHVGYSVKYVRNFTDVDDKIMKRAAEVGEDPLALSQRFCAEFQADMAALQCLPPSVEPKVSAHIDDIVAMIAQDENRAGERVKIDERKRNPADFALWKGSKPGEVSWESPWGRGRPGWHIECSAMSARHLGQSFDIHGGGRDLIFPHHENELAQSRAAARDSHVAYWVHNGFVTVDSEKMSKSVGNFFTIREVLGRYSAVALRWFLLGTQYRSPINYSQRQLDQASDRAFYLYQVLEDTNAVLALEAEPAAAGAAAAGGGASKEAMATAKKLKEEFEAAMADDLATSQAVAALSEPLKSMNDLLHTKKVPSSPSDGAHGLHRYRDLALGRKDKARVASLRALQEAVTAVMSILGLPSHGYSQILDELKQLALKRAGLTEQDVERRMQERAEARAAKDFKRSDEIRQELAAAGVMLMDGGDGTLWKPGCVEEPATAAPS
eukprot:jgi/Mesen1/4586/ME000232S03856